MAIETIGLVTVTKNAARKVAVTAGGNIKAKAASKYLLQVENSDIAPENVTVKRVGEDLQVSFEGSDTPDLVIQDFFADGMDSQLYGVAENGQLYAYVRTDGEGAYSQWMMADGESADIALGGEALSDGTPYLASTFDDAAGFVLWPWLLGVAGVGVAIAAIVHHNRDSGHHHSADETPPDAPSTRITDQGAGLVTIDGRTEPNAKVMITLPDGTAVTTQADANGDYSIDVPAPERDGEIIVKAEDAAGNVSPGTEVPYHDITSPAAPSVKNTDPGTGTLTIDGKAEPGSTLIVELPDGSTASTTTGADGDYRIDLSAPKESAEIEVRAQDAAGNVSPPTPADYTGLVAPTATAAMASFIDEAGLKESTFPNGTDQRLDGSVSEGLPKNETLMVYRDGEKGGIAPVSVTSWSFTDKSGLDVGSTYKYEAQLDAAVGNACIGNGISGTCYNDTFMVAQGEGRYDGGGSTMVSKELVWSSTGNMDMVDYVAAGSTALTIDPSIETAQSKDYSTATFSNIEGLASGRSNDAFHYDAGDKKFEVRGGDDLFHLTVGGNDTLLYRALDSGTASGNGRDTAIGFTVGADQASKNADRIDIADLLISGRADADGPAHYVNGVATMDPGEDVGNYLSARQSGIDTTLSTDRDGKGGAHAATDFQVIKDVDFDLATLLANQQILV